MMLDLANTNNCARSLQSIKSLFLKVCQHFCVCLKWYLLLADAFLRQHLWTLFFKVCSEWSVCFMFFFYLGISFILRIKKSQLAVFQTFFIFILGGKGYIFICNFKHKSSNLLFNSGILFYVMCVFYTVKFNTVRSLVKPV